MTQVKFSFNPTGPEASEDLAERLERVFGAARWVHNRAMIRQWEEIHAGRVPPSLQQLIEECIDVPAKEQATSWLLLVPRGVLVDELDDLTTQGCDDLADIRRQRDLPLKTKKEDQEIIFPEDSFSLTVTPEGVGIDLDMTGQIVGMSLDVPADAKTDAVKIERTTHNLYKATVYFI